MPIQGSDLTAAQVSLFRQAADIINPGMTDGQVLDWINAQAVPALLEHVVKPTVLKKMREDANALLRSWNDQYEAAAG